MYYAINQDVNNTEVYQGFLCDILKSGNQHYISIFSHIITEAQNLSQSHDFYSIDSERFSIISFFAQHEDVISKMDAKNLTNKDFEALLKCFEYKCHC
jgi:hypothetical protein